MSNQTSRELSRISEKKVIKISKSFGSFRYPAGYVGEEKFRRDKTGEIYRRYIKKALHALYLQQLYTQGSWLLKHFYSLLRRHVLLFVFYNNGLIVKNGLLTETGDIPAFIADMIPAASQ